MSNGGRTPAIGAYQSQPPDPPPRRRRPGIRGPQDDPPTLGSEERDRDGGNMSLPVQWRQYIGIRRPDDADWSRWITSVTPGATSIRDYEGRYINEGQSVSAPRGAIVLTKSARTNRLRLDVVFDEDHWYTIERSVINYSGGWHRLLRMCARNWLALTCAERLVRAAEDSIQTFEQAAQRARSPAEEQVFRQAQAYFVDYIAVLGGRAANPSQPALRAAFDAWLSDMAADQQMPEAEVLAALQASLAADIGPVTETNSDDPYGQRVMAATRYVVRLGLDPRDIQRAVDLIGGNPAWDDTQLIEDLNARHARSLGITPDPPTLPPPSTGSAARREQRRRRPPSANRPVAGGQRNARNIRIPNRNRRETE